MNILGISAFYHDSAACLVQDGRIVAAAQEERFSRVKHDPGLPSSAILYCLGAGRVAPGELDAVVFYEKPLTKFTRLLSTYLETAPNGLRPFLLAIPSWLKDKAWSPLKIERFLVRSGMARPRKMLFAEHHLSHAASAFFPSPFEEAAILTVDGVGEWTTTGVAVGEGNNLRLVYEQRFPHSLGLLYSAFTYFTGFKVNSGEYKLMGLAPYGQPTYVDLIRDKLVEIREDGSFRLNLDYFGFLDELKMTNRRFSELFGGPPRPPESDITVRDMNLARSIQVVTEEIMFKMARYARAISGKSKLCLAGGVALNCVANGTLLRSGLFDDMWIQPAAGDAGGALGAALFAWHSIYGNRREVVANDQMSGALLGPAFSCQTIRQFLEDNQIPFHEMFPTERASTIAEIVAQGKVVGLFQGRMEFGPRALGNRSIIADARDPRIQSHLNLATKFREGFRPFAPIVLQEDVGEYFEALKTSPYMLQVAQVLASRCIPGSERNQNVPLAEWVNTPRSDVPAITHVDYSARVQTVDSTRFPQLHAILSAFKATTGFGIMVNTSFNVRGEPIVCTPEDAYVCFMRTGIDVLVLEDFLLIKSEQPSWRETQNWRDEYGLD